MTEESIRADELREGDVLTDGAAGRVLVIEVERKPKTVVLHLEALTPMRTKMRVHHDEYCPVVERDHG